MNLVLFLLSFYLFPTSRASLGDIFPTYKDCRETCVGRECKEDGGYSKPSSKSVFVRALWSCKENCKYDCMWETVDGFTKKGWPPPQFHGKWPFARMMGMQEPASALFSLFNLFVHAKMFSRFLREVTIGSPMYFLWFVYALVCFNAWIWSTVFHTRDVFLTETMDYLSAFSMIFYSLYISCMRSLLGKKKLYSVGLTLLFVWLFLEHAAYLVVGGFDYKYNLWANILAGVLSGSVCLSWSGLQWRAAPHARLITLTVLLVAVTTLLEVAEFPPYLWVLDAHALWHLSTVPIPYFLWRFAIEDCKYLKKHTFKG